MNLKPTDVVYTDSKVSITIITSCPASNGLCPSDNSSRCTFLAARIIQLVLFLTIAMIDVYVLTRVFNSPMGVIPALKGTLFLTLIIIALTLPHTITDVYRRYYKKPSLYSPGAAILLEIHFFLSYIILLICVGMVHIKAIGDLCEPESGMIVDRPDEICGLLKAELMILSLATFFWVPTMKMVYEGVSGNGCPRRNVQVNSTIV